MSSTICKWKFTYHVGEAKQPGKIGRGADLLSILIGTAARSTPSAVLPKPARRWGFSRSGFPSGIAWLATSDCEGSSSEMTITRESAWCLLTEFTQSESLQKHALSVEACMRAYARKFGGDEDHSYKGNAILKERGFPDEICRAIMSHAEYTGVTRDTPMEKTLFACDELAGFITAVALIKPGKSLAEVDAKSVRKRMKDKAFARKVNRDDIVNGALDMGVDLEEHITFCIEALQGVADKLGLDGSAARAS